MKFGENLKLIRKSHKISQETLADKLGVSRQSISKWETGENYPSTQNIMCLCTIFKCKINELIHEDFVDINFMDEEIKMSVVKFKQEKQKKVKVISKIIYIVSHIAQISLDIAMFILGIIMILTPFAIDKISINSNNILLNNTKIGYLTNNVETVISYYNSHSTTEIIINTEIIIIGIIIGIFLMKLIFTSLYKLFLNIHNGDTPFTIENINYIKKISYNIIAYIIIITYLLGMITQIIVGVDLQIELEITDILFGIIVYSISYIFEYGYEIQLDSKGKMYGEYYE